MDTRDAKIRPDALERMVTWFDRFLKPERFQQFYGEWNRREKLAAKREERPRGNQNP